MLNLFDARKPDIIEMWKNFIYPREEPSRVVIAENVPEGVAGLRGSDMIFVFDEEELVVLAYRFNREDYNIFKWLSIKFKASRLVKRFNNEKIESTYTVHKDYLDVTFFKGWWSDCLESSILRF